MPSTTWPSAARAAAHPARAAADVEGRPRAVREQRQVAASVGVAPPLVDGQRLQDLAQPDHAARPPAQRLGEDVGERRALGAAATSVSVMRTPSSHASREPRSGRQPGDRVGVGGLVDVAQRGGRGDLEAGGHQRGPGVGAGGRGRHRARRRAPPRGPGRAGRAPTSRRPRPARAPRRGRPGARPPPAAASAVRCGVSMPIWTTGAGPARVDVGVGQPLGEVRRPRCGWTVQPPRALRSSRPPTARSRSPSSARWQRPGRTAARHAAAACRGAPRRRRARPPPCRCAAPSRVFTRPATGALATTSTATALMRAPARSRGRRAPCRAPSRTPWTGCPRRAGGRRRRARRSASRPRSPSAAARPGSRSGGPARRGRAGPARRQTRIGAMSCTGSPIRRRSHQTTSALPARACHGHTPRAHRAPATDGQVGPAGPDVVEQRQQVGGVERAVAVHHRDVLAGRPPARRRARRRRTRAVGSATTRGAERRGHARRCRRWSRCRRRSPRSRPGPAAAGATQRRLPRRGTGSTRSQTVGPCRDARQPRRGCRGSWRLRTADAAPAGRSAVRRALGSAACRPRRRSAAGAVGRAGRRAVLVVAVAVVPPLADWPVPTARLATLACAHVPAAARPVATRASARARCRRCCSAVLRLAVRRRRWPTGSRGGRLLAGVVRRGARVDAGARASSTARAGCPHVLGNPYEYLRTARAGRTTCTPLLQELRRPDPGRTRRDSWPTHVAGHPPGALLFFVGLVAARARRRLRRRPRGHAARRPPRPSPCWSRCGALGAEAVARRAAPFLVLGAGGGLQWRSRPTRCSRAVAAWGLAAWRWPPGADAAGWWLGRCRRAAARLRA